MLYRTVKEDLNHNLLISLSDDHGPASCLTYEDIQKHGQSTPYTTVIVYTFVTNILYRGVPANQLAFIMRYSVSILLAQIDNAYVTLPNTAKKNRAGDKPSHLVLKFLTDSSEYYLIILRLDVDLHI